MKNPICIVSFNRALYLDSLLHSLSCELNDFDVFVVDNNSKESLMQKVVEKWSKNISFLKLPGNDWINDEYKAKNAFLNVVNSEYRESSYSIFLQDDMQYVGPKNCLKLIAGDLYESNFLNVSLTGVRKSTIQATYSNVRIRNVWKIKDNHFGTTGLYKNEVFNTVGRYEQDFPLTKEYWGRGEDDYNSRVLRTYGHDRFIAGYSHVPVFAGVWNDPRGHYSFLRNDKRYGHYLPPHQETYYSNMTQQEYDALLQRNEPSSFVDIAHPIGWTYAKSTNGDQEKYPQSKIMIEGPEQDII